MKRSLHERLAQGGVLCAEGYLFEMERRGYLQAGSFVPEVALDHPDVLANLHREFVHAGSDVIVAFTYNAHREKMRIMEKEHLLEPLNTAALRIAKDVAAEEWPETPLVAGNISNTNVFNPDDPASRDDVRTMFEEMVGWAVDAEVDYMVCETFYYHEEAVIALEEVRKSGLPCVVTLGLFAEGVLRDGLTVEESCRRLEDKGADVVGMNCFRGPETMLPHLRRIRSEINGHMAALPVPFRTTKRHPTFFNLPDPNSSADQPFLTTFPTALDPMACNRYEMARFAQNAYDMGIRYLGVCCGCSAVHIREMAHALGRNTPASSYTPDMSKQFLFGDDDRLKQHITTLRDKA
ncbi:betaine-homocysteine S-methyltransferase [Paucidesulfovibrio gracilis DSM 16080]|uniref:Betaine-homocysteine S-methyltransferase n=1 Tax=Paucidesulfovibrio gracilis DSM 16080 TaxID=1121449 RepID=A0A1T4W4B0_9BACT|nr:homocysteine S-methyltransferase family protein [Paucidesulfovibrio gracilis]SKA72086.1 betaine-homocysteine S-methyltransferase [Paucidesulfovibrio gracilis DSM 16080]